MKTLLNKIARLMNNPVSTFRSIIEKDNAIDILPKNSRTHTIMYIDICDYPSLELMIPYATFWQGSKVEDELDYIIEVDRIKEWTCGEFELYQGKEAKELMELVVKCRLNKIELIRFW